MPAELYDYTIAIGPPPDDVARDLITETADRFPGPAGMQIPPEQAGFLTLITQLVGARSAVEVGTFTGFSSLAIAAGRPARSALRTGPALGALRALPAEPTIALVFIDTDKPNYLAYWEELVPRV